MEGILESVMIVELKIISLTIAKGNAIVHDVRMDLRNILWWKRRMTIKRNYFFFAVRIVKFRNGL